MVKETYLRNLQINILIYKIFKYIYFAISFKNLLQTKGAFSQRDPKYFYIQSKVLLEIILALLILNFILFFFPQTRMPTPLLPCVQFRSYY